MKIASASPAGGGASTHPAAQPAPTRLRDPGGGARELQHRADDRAFDLGRIILLRLGPEIGQVIGREIDAADEATLAVDDDQLAMQPAQHVQAQPEQPRQRIEDLEAHAGGGQAADELFRQIR